MLIERKIIEQGVNKAKLSDSLFVQKMKNVKPDFMWEFHCCHRSFQGPYEASTLDNVRRMIDPALNSK